MSERKHQTIEDVIADMEACAEQYHHGLRLEPQTIGHVFDKFTYELSFYAGSQTTADALEAKDARIAELEEASWRLIDQWPAGIADEFKAFLVRCPERKNTYCVVKRDGKFSVFGGYALEEEVSHYMPLPLPPLTPKEATE
jgi:hypothetical protein